MPSIPIPWLILIALGLALALRVAQAVIKALARREFARGVLWQAGVSALSKVPDAIKLERLSVAPSWKDAGVMESMARPLLARDFVDCGVFLVDRMPGVKIWSLLNEETSVAAFLYEHPKTAPWIEFSVRYEDGNTTALSTRPAAGIQPASFFRRIQGDRGTPADQLYERLLRERPAAGIKRVTRDTVVGEFEAAYRKMMLWQKSKGLSVQEVAAVIKKRGSQ